MALLFVVVVATACSGNGDFKNNTTPQTPDNNPEVLAKTFADYMQHRDYENAAMLFAEFCEGSYSPLSVHYKMEELNAGNFYAMSDSPAKIEVIENNGITCHVKTIVEVYGSHLDSHLYLKKENGCWRIDKYEL